MPKRSFAGFICIFNRYYQPFMKSILAFLALLAVIVLSTQAQGYYPPASSIDFHTDTLTIYPPDSLPGDPVVLIGYNIYVDNAFSGNVYVQDQNDTVDYIFDITTLMPGVREFCAKALYNSWISEPVCDSGDVVYGFDAPFFEDWSSGDFETNMWTASSENWSVWIDEGNPAPAARFNGSPHLEDYSAVLESFAIRTDSYVISRLMMNYDVRLDCANPTGLEKLYLQIWNESGSQWVTVEIVSNQNGSFSWMNKWLHLNSFLGKIIKLRFVATGAYSADISSWDIDNIHVYRSCFGASALQVDEFLEYNVLYWDGPVGCPLVDWIHWDDGVNYSSIGTGGAAEFDVAARWTTSQLSAYDGIPITKVNFFPVEFNASYSIRIWKNIAASELVLDFPVTDPDIGEWNIIEIPDTILVDATKELWVGYHINTTTGYPAGIDDGPAIDGYGNMIFYEGEWSTLLEINPELDYNWNIQCLIGPEHTELTVFYKIYRQTNFGDFEFYDNSFDWEWMYFDTNIVLADYYCYQVSMVWTQDGDTCESDPSNIACEIFLLGVDQNEQELDLRIFPVPAGDRLTVEANREMQSVEMSNLTGERIMAITPFDRKSIINVSQIQPGIYILKIVTESIIIYKKILII